MRSIPCSIAALALATALAYPSHAIAAAAEAPAAADDQPQQPVPPAGAGADDEDDLDSTPIEPGQIVVIATRISGQVETDVPPIVQLDAEEIAAYGASSVAELLTALAPQTGSGRGRGSGPPVVLLNGMRIGSFREMRNFPPEAIRRVEVLPEEVALQYGFRPDQRVTNFILKDNFQSLLLETDFGGPSSGGFTVNEQEVALTKIAGKTRINVSLAADDSSMLTEAERGIIQPARDAGVALLATDPDPAGFRSLIADSRSMSANATVAMPTGIGQGISLNASAEHSHARNLFGLNEALLNVPGETAPLLRVLNVPGPLTRNTVNTSLSLSGSYTRPVGSWLMTFTADGNKGRTVTRTDRRATTAALQALVTAGAINPRGTISAEQLGLSSDDVAISKTGSGSALLTFNGRLFALPAGDASVTLRGGYTHRSIDSSNSRATVPAVSLKRDIWNTGFSLDVPLTSRRNDVLADIGSISLNLNAGYSDVSDFGGLVEYGAGLSWGVTDKLDISASYIAEDGRPSLEQLGGAIIVTPNVPVFDFNRGETVLVSITSGGNPFLVKERKRDIKLAANWELPFLNNSSLLFEYLRNRSFDATSSFPLLTPEIEAAFASRVTRDSTGRLFALDQRPVTYDRIANARLRGGIFLSGTVGKAPEAGGGPGGPPGASGRPGGPGGSGGPPRSGGAGRRGPGGGGGPPMMFGGPGGGQGRWSFSAVHTYRLDDRILIAPGVPELDLLRGSAVGESGGAARHGLELEGGVFYKGIGVRISGAYDSGSRVDGSGLPGSQDLRFGPLAKFDLRSFFDLAQLAPNAKFLKGSRFSFRVDNLFNTARRVTDEGGAVPLRYQPGFLEPRGRYIEIDFRKLF